VVVDYISQGISMQQLQIFGYEQRLSQHVNDLSREMTELRQLREMVRVAERRAAEAPSCSANKSLNSFPRSR